MLDQLAKAGSAFDGRSAATQMAQVIRVGQADVATAAPKMLVPPSAGGLAVDAFLASYTGAALKQLVGAAPVMA
jgi:hypothetical protein